MKVVLKGRVFLKDTDTGLYGVTVKVQDAPGSPAQPNTPQISQRQRTNRQGAFSFHLDLNHPAPGPDGRMLRLCAYDVAGTPIAEEAEVLLPDPAELRHLPVTPESLANAKLPRQPLGAPILADTGLTGIRQAVSAAHRLSGDSGVALSLATYLCSLPPLFFDADLPDLAFGVLEGSGQDFQDLRNRLQDLTLYSLRNGFQPLPIDKAQAAINFSPQRMRALAKQLTTVTRRGARLLPPGHLSAIALAAIKVYGQDLVVLSRVLGVIDHQLLALGSLHRLQELAQHGLSGGATDLQEFATLLHHFGGGCGRPGFPQEGIPGPGGRPPAGGGRPGPIPGRDLSWPIPGGDLFPGIPEHLPPGIGEIPERAEMWACMAEFLTNPAITRHWPPRPYAISRIHPPRACPGTVVTITGTGLTFEDLGGEVLFSGTGRGITVPGQVLAWTATSIQVVVPEGATCGNLELRIPASRVSLPSCGGLELFLGPSEPFRFEGGATRIAVFRLLEEGSCHWQAGGIVRFSWLTCNTDTLTLTLQDASGTTLDTFTGLRDRDVPFSIVLPAITTDAFLVAALLARGPCGEVTETRRFFVRRVLPDLAALALGTDHFRNWHGNIEREALFAAPREVADIVDLVHAAGQLGLRLGILGSQWSYSDCVTGSDGAPVIVPPGPGNPDMPDLLVKTDCSRESPAGSPDFGGCEIATVIPFALREDAPTILRGDLLEAFTPPPAPTSPPLPEAPCTPPANRFVHVRAGIKLAHLNCLLDQKCLAMPGLGGSNGQSLAGAISTGTHGTFVPLPPMQDFVRAIHLVGPGGQQWWIEPEGDAITDRARMQELMDTQVLDPCLELVYDDGLFNACLVSMGAAGIFHALVLEAAPKHHLRQTTQRISFTQARAIILGDILGPGPPYFAEFVIGPDQVVHFTTRQPAHPADDQDLATDETTLIWSSLTTGWLATTLLTRVLPAIPEQIAQLSLLLSSPFGVFFLREIQERLALLELLHRTLPDTIAALQSPLHSDEILADTAVRALNAIWNLWTPVVNGRDIVEEFQHFVIGLLRPPGVKTKNSFVITNEQTDCHPMTHDPFERRIQSYEYVMAADQVLSFVDRVQDLAERVKRTAPLILTINIRFTQGTRALLGMQQFGLTGYVELWTVRGVTGSEAFMGGLEELTRDLPVIPHWGHFHREFSGGRAKDLSLVYPRLAQWRAAMNRLARRADRDPNTFRHGFVRRRGLLPDL